MRLIVVRVTYDTQIQDGIKGGDSRFIFQAESNPSNNANVRVKEMEIICKGSPVWKVGDVLELKLVDKLSV